MERINQNTKYLYSYPSLRVVKNDFYGDKLTFGEEWIKAEVKNETKISGSWRGQVEVELFNEYKEPHFHIQNDWGLISEVEKVSIKFKKDMELPKSVELFFTNDGYNYTIFEIPEETVKEEGDAVVYEFGYKTPVKAKGVRVMVFAELDKEMEFSDLCVCGKKNENEIKLLSKGLSYEWEGEKANATPYRKDLTDGDMGRYDEKEKFESRLASSCHPVSTSKASVISTDLGKECNICEVMINTLSSPEFSFVPLYITVEYSLDGKEYFDFGQGYRQGDFGLEDQFTSRYIVTRNHTVKARYIKIYVTAGDNAAAISQFSVYGTSNAVKEMEYDHFHRKEILTHTNVLENKEVLVNGESTYKLTDNIFSHGEFDLEEKENEIICDMGEVKKEINSVMLYFMTKNKYDLPESVKTYISVDGKNYELIDNKYYCHKTGRYLVVRMYFEKREARYIKFVVETGENPATILEVAAYDKQPQLPLFRGGFFQTQLWDKDMEVHVVKNSEYMWYIVMKGMKDIGMDHIVIQYGLNFQRKISAVDSPVLRERGYKPIKGCSSKEPLEVILKTAEKLSMKVFLGTVETYSQYRAIMEHGGVDHIKAEMEDGLELIKYMHEHFNKYKSFVGYYFPDETCDEWLNARHGLEVYRTDYATQARLIRELDPTKKTVISPAIWREGSPAEGEKNLYELIKAEEEGGRPIIDIVAAQDCLGRRPTLYVETDVYRDFEEHIEAWAKGVRKAGAEFWNDAETFEITYMGKRHADNVHAIEMESKYSNGIVMFDYVFFFTDVTKGTVNSDATFNNGYILNRYVKRYMEDYRDKDRIGMN
ncbi:MAG: DUF4434 domain-containing protein [Clostridia bacterium]|nr:DUF4434 domain-containing protein [Clostridia bacterium]